MLNQRKKQKRKKVRNMKTKYYWIIFKRKKNEIKKLNNSNY